MPDPNSQPAPRWPLLAFLALCAVGTAVAVDLTVIHLKVHTDPTYVSFCALSKEVNCDTVAESDWSVFLGVPNSVWGILGYLGMAFLAVWGLSRRSLGRAWPAGLLLLLSGFSVAVSIVLGVVSKTVIHSMCLMCIASWAVAAGLFVLAVVHARAVGIGAALRDDARALRSRPRALAGLALAGLLPAAALMAAYPKYWRADGPVGPGALASGVDEEGHPWVGAATPALTVVEYSDYECPFCARAHRDLRALLEKRGGEVRLVHRNFPLDSACNPLIKRAFHAGACERATAAICAGEQGKLWEMSDTLFLAQHKRALKIDSLARRLGLDLRLFEVCMKSERARGKLAKDVEAALKLGVSATPTFIVGEKVVKGALSAEDLDLQLSKAKEKPSTP